MEIAKDRKLFQILSLNKGKTIKFSFYFLHETSLHFHFLFDRHHVKCIFSWLLSDRTKGSKCIFHARKEYWESKTLLTPGNSVVVHHFIHNYDDTCWLDSDDSNKLMMTYQHKNYIKKHSQNVYHVYAIMPWFDLEEDEHKQMDFWDSWMANDDFFGQIIE